MCDKYGVAVSGAGTMTFPTVEDARQMAVAASQKGRTAIVFQVIETHNVDSKTTVDVVRPE